MLSERPWKLEAIARLLIGVFIFMCAGSLLGTAFYPGPAFQKHGTLFFVLAAIAGVFLAAALIELGKPWDLENFRRTIHNTRPGPLGKPLLLHLNRELTYVADDCPRARHGGDDRSAETARRRSLRAL